MVITERDPTFYITHSWELHSAALQGDTMNCYTITPPRLHKAISLSKPRCLCGFSPREISRDHNAMLQLDDTVMDIHYLS